MATQATKKGQFFVGMDEQEGQTMRVAILMIGIVLIVFFLLIGSCNQGYYETLQKCTAAGLQIVRDQCIR